MTDRQPPSEQIQRAGGASERLWAEQLSDGEVSADPAISWDPTTGGWVEPHIRPSGEAPPASPPSQLRTAVLGGLVGALLTAIVVVPFVRNTAPGQPAVERRLAEGISSGQGNGGTIVDIAARARPWVVNVNVTGQQQSPFGDLPLQGTGSGVILRSDGHILTNEHVARDADRIQVTLATGETVPAEVVAGDPDTDIAVIKVARGELPSAVIGSAKDLVVGETVVAIGSPLGLEQTVTSGIVSALGRTVQRPGQPPLVDMIQTDAAVTQGNSGGALVNADGAVIGINTAIAASPEVGAEGIAFATPIDVAVAVAEELIDSGRATHPWLGITGANITPEVAEEFSVAQGARVIEVLPGSPADEAGLRPDDVVTSFAGEGIDSMDDLVVAIREHEVGETLDIGIVRDGDELSLRVTLGDKPDSL